MPKLNQISAILIDLDDTLLIEEASAFNAFIETAKELEKAAGIEPEKFVPVIRQHARELWYTLPTIQYCKRIGISSWEALWAEFSDLNDNQQKLKELKHYYQTNAWYNALKYYQIDNYTLACKLSDKFKAERRSRHILFSDTIDFLDKLKKNYKLALLTNGTPDLQHEKVLKSRLDKYFGFIAISGELDVAKPDKKFFDIVMQKLKIEPSEAVMIGNNLETDIQGAINAGIRSVWVNRENKNISSQVQPDFEVAGLKEILTLLNL